MPVSGTKITEVKTIKVEHGCFDFPIYLQWFNKQGGISYWLFQNYNEESSKTSIDTPYNVNVLDLETAIGTDDIIGKTDAPEILVGAKVKAEDINGLRGLHQGSKVLMLANPDTWTTEGAKWKRVIVKTGSFLAVRSNSSYFDVSFNIVLPRINIQQG